MKANTRVSTNDEILHNSALATLEVAKSTCVDDKLRQINDLSALPLIQTATLWYQGVPAGHTLAQVHESCKTCGLKREMR